MLRNRQHYVIDNTEDNYNTLQVDAIQGIILPGIDVYVVEFLPSNHKVKELSRRVVELIKYPPNAAWRWRKELQIADKNSYKPFEISPLSLGKTIVYQKITRCGKFEIRGEIVHAEVDKHGYCRNGNLPRNPTSKANINITEYCSPIYKKIPEVGNCVAEDYYIPVEFFYERQYEHIVGATWKARPELVDYQNEFNADNIGEKLLNRIKLIAKSPRTHYDWRSLNSSIGLLWSNTIMSLGRYKYKKPEEDKYYFLVASCGQFTFYTGLVHEQAINIDTGKCVNGEGGFACDQVDSNGQLFVPEVRQA